MKFSLNIFSSKFAQRIFFVFSLCALIPVCGLAAITYRHVNQQFDNQLQVRLKQSVKTYSLFLYERFLILETELTLAAHQLSSSDVIFSSAMQGSYLERLQKRFTAMALFREQGQSIGLYGRIEGLSLNQKESDHLKTGHTLIKASESAGQPVLLMMVLLDAQRPEAGLLAAQINSVYLLALNREYQLPEDTGLVIRDESHRVLFSSIEKDMILLNKLSQTEVDKNSGNFEFESGKEVYLACFRWIFMQPKFLFPGLNTTFIQSETHAFMQTVEFRKIFLQVILLSILVSAILSIFFIRRSLEPLKKLKKGTLQIADNNFAYRVEINSRDEFEELSQAFNNMAVQLTDQFKTLESSAQITHAVLSSLDTRTILNTVLFRMTDCFACEAVSIGLISKERPNTIQCYIADRQGESKTHRIDRDLFPSDLVKLHNNHEFMIIDQLQDVPAWLPVINGKAITVYLVLPIYLDSEFSAIFSLAYDRLDTLNKDRRAARQMADQVAVALSNSRLMEQLNDLNWGTIKALARAVDAKSSWTAGHSERVTGLTLDLAEILIDDPRERENLHRAALLHDIGKLGISTSILDKPGKLDAQEYEKIQTHPVIGARILEPIGAYTAIIPMVLQHHERFDGKGYPNGLAGKSIHPGARILAVADVFDAMKSDRPYREGMALDRVLKIIQEESGRQFDPEVVEALLYVMDRKEKKAA